MDKFYTTMGKLLPTEATQKINDEITVHKPAAIAAIRKMMANANKKYDEFVNLFDETVEKIVEKIDHAANEFRLRQIISEFKSEREPLEKLKKQYETKLKGILGNIEIPVLSYANLLKILSFKKYSFINQMIENLFRLDLILKGRQESYMKELEKLKQTKITTGMTEKQNEDSLKIEYDNLKNEMKSDFEISIPDKVNLLFEAFASYDILDYTIGSSEDQVIEKIKTYNVTHKLAETTDNPMLQSFAEKKNREINKPNTKKPGYIWDSKSFGEATRKYTTNITRRAAVKRLEEKRAIARTKRENQQKVKRDMEVERRRGINTIGSENSGGKRRRTVKNSSGRKNKK
jgi:hypothetical protein